MSHAATIDGQSVQWNKKWPGINAGPNKCLWAADAPASTHQRRLRAYWRLLQSHDPQPSWECIELGSGRGTISQYLAALGCRVVLTDLSPIALEMAEDNWREAKLPAPECLRIDCQHTKIKRETFDLTHSVGLLEHFEDPLPTLRECKRLLRKGGLTWHIIVNGQDRSEMFRTDRTPEEYTKLATEAGLSDAACRATLYRGVLLLTGKRS